MSRHVLGRREQRDDDPLAVFVRGATMGAFVGAVIAGSTIWRRVRRQASSAGSGSLPRAGRPTTPTEGADTHRTS
jgi:hypothetical protein